MLALGSFVAATTSLLLYLRTHRPSSSAPPSSPLLITRLLCPDANASVRVLFEAFSKDEYSWARALGRGDESLLEYLDKCVIPCARERDCPQSLVAKRNETVVGVLVLETYGPTRVPACGVCEVVEPNEAIEGILAQASGEFDRGLRERGWDDKVCYVAWLGVDSTARRDKVGLMLMEQGLREARRCGFRYACAFCTSPKSESLCVKAGFEVWARIPYKEFTIRGVQPFKSLPDAFVVVARKL